MKIHHVIIPSLFSLMGVTVLDVAATQAQASCASVPNTPGSSCADIYSATPERVQLTLGQREMMLNTASPESLSTFANIAPSNATLRKDPTDSSAFNVLTTGSYARADLQLSDGSLVWTKPYTQIGLASGNSCSVSNLYEAQPGQPSPVLCLRSGSVLVVAPPNQSQIAIATDEGTIFTPGTVYLINRDAAAQRTEVFVFSGGGSVRVLMPNDMACVSPDGVTPGTKVQPLGQSQECVARVQAGQYVTVMANSLSNPKPFDLPAWVATDPFFAPLRGEVPTEGVGELSTQSATANQIASVRTDMPMKLVQGTPAMMPSSVMSSINAAQPGVQESVGLQSNSCPTSVTVSPGGAAAPLSFMPSPVLPPKPELVVPPPVMPVRPARPVRGLW